MRYRSRITASAFYSSPLPIDLSGGSRSLVLSNRTPPGLSSCRHHLQRRFYPEGGLPDRKQTGWRSAVFREVFQRERHPHIDFEFERICTCCPGKSIRYRPVSFGTKLGGYRISDIRRMLILAQRTICSPSFRVEDLVRIYVKQQNRGFDNKRAVRAMILGDYDRHVDQSSEFIMNVFLTESSRPYSPALLTDLEVLAGIKNKPEPTLPLVMRLFQA